MFCNVVSLRNFSLCVFLLLAAESPAAILLSMTPSGGTNANTGAAGPGKTLSVYIGEDVSSDDALIGVDQARFTLEAGSIVSGTEQHGTTGFFAANNLAPGGSTFSITSTTTFVIAQELDDFVNGEPLVNAAPYVKWFEFQIDTTGLLPGTYALTLDNPNTAFADTSFTPLIPNNNLTFTVSAVPEPGSLSFLLGFSSVAFLRRKRRQTA